MSEITTTPTPTRRVLLSVDELCKIASGYVRQLYGDAPGPWEAIVEANGTRITIAWANGEKAGGGEDGDRRGALRLVKTDPTT
jgi:hypothetical protein